MMANSRFVTGDGAFGESSVIRTDIHTANTFDRTVAVFASRIGRLAAKNGLRPRGSVAATGGIANCCVPELFSAKSWLIDRAGLLVVAVMKGWVADGLPERAAHTTVSVGPVPVTIVLTFTRPGSRHLGRTLWPASENPSGSIDVPVTVTVFPANRVGTCVASRMRLPSDIVPEVAELVSPKGIGIAVVLVASDTVGKLKSASS